MALLARLERGRGGEMGEMEDCGSLICGYENN